MSEVKFIDRHGNKVPDLLLEIKDEWAEDFKDQVITEYLVDEDLILEDIIVRGTFLAAVVSSHKCKCSSQNTTWLNSKKEWVCQDCELDPL
jgi:hypothetical protein